jgi:hypothetical protein
MRNIRRKNDRCFECHGKEAADVGQKMVTGTKAALLRLLCIQSCINVYNYEW